MRTTLNIDESLLKKAFQPSTVATLSVASSPEFVDNFQQIRAKRSCVAMQDDSGKREEMSLRNMRSVAA